MIARCWSASPTESFPKMVSSSAERQGLYGFFGNNAVQPERLLAAHKDQTLQRIDAEGSGIVLVLHDTTSFAFGGEARREGVGWIGRDQQGFFGHFALAVSADGTRRPFGVIGLSIFMRERPPPRAEKLKVKELSKKERAADADRESLRWGALIEQTSDSLRGHAIPVHVMDREADSYELFARMIAGGHRFVSRARALDRIVTCLEDDFVEPGKLRPLVQRSVPLASRAAHFNRRSESAFPGQDKKHPPRSARSAQLEIGATTIRMARPAYLSETLPPTIDINVVHVREVNPPDGVEPVEWFLLTSEAIMNPDDVLRIVDYYRARWTIEEYFQAIKTGCAYETRQLESLHGLLVALALCIPIAWQMLLLRSQSRTEPDAPATAVITDECLQALRIIAREPLPPNPTVRQVYYAIAALGGHIKSNGPPGWRTLRAGFDKLLFAEKVLAAQAAHAAREM